MTTGTHRVVEAILSIGIIWLFFVPWLQFEVMEFSATELPPLAEEYFAGDSPYPHIIYLIYTLPLFAIYILTGSVMNVRMFYFPLKIWMLLIIVLFFSLVGIYMATEELQLRYREGAYLTFIATIGLVFLEFIRKND